MSCLFCKIANHTIPSNVVAENDKTLAFLDIHPLAPGHTIVIPKLHSERLSDLPESDNIALFLTVKSVSDNILASIKPDGFTVGINDGPGGGQGVPHVHVHIIPRWTGDKGGSLHSIVHNPPNESVEEILTKIKLTHNL